MAPEFDQDAFDSALDKSLPGAIERSGVIAHIPKEDEVATLMRGFEELDDSIASRVDDGIARTFDEKLEVSLKELGFDPEQYRSMKDSLKKLDRIGTPDSARSGWAPDGKWRREKYTKIGRAAVASVFDFKRMPIPKEFAEQGIERAQLGSTDTKGGITIPDLTLDDWSILGKDHSIAERIFETEDLGESLTLIVPTLVTDVDTSHLATEGTSSASETDATLDTEANSSVEAQVMGAFVKISRKIPPQRMTAMANQIGRLLMRAAGHKKDKWIFNNGSSPFNSMMNRAGNSHTLAAGNTTFSSAKYPDWSKLQFAPDENSIGNGVYLLSPSVFGDATRLVDDQNRPLWLTGWVAPQGMVPSSPVSEGSPAVFLNRPCWLSTTMPAVSASAADTAFGLYFDPQFGTIGRSQDPFFETDESKEREKFMTQIHIFSVGAFHYSQPTGAAVIKTAAS